MVCTSSRPGQSIERFVILNSYRGNLSALNFKASRHNAHSTRSRESFEPNLPPATSSLILICQKDVWYPLYHPRQQQRARRALCGDEGEFFPFLLRRDCDIFIIILCSNSARFLGTFCVSCFLCRFFGRAAGRKKVMIICFKGTS